MIVAVIVCNKVFRTGDVISLLVDIIDTEVLFCANFEVVVVRANAHVFAVTDVLIRIVEVDAVVQNIEIFHACTVGGDFSAHELDGENLAFIKIHVLGRKIQLRNIVGRSILRVYVAIVTCHGIGQPRRSVCIGVIMERSNLIRGCSRYLMFFIIICFVFSAAVGCNILFFRKTQFLILVF